MNYEQIISPSKTFTWLLLRIVQDETTHILAKQGMLLLLEEGDLKSAVW